MLPLLTEKLPEIERLCKLHGVRRLEVVGSAAREVDFDCVRDGAAHVSDFDLLVEFEPKRAVSGLLIARIMAGHATTETSVKGMQAELRAIRAYRRLHEALVQTLGRKVDLLMLEMLDIFQEAIAWRDRVLLFATKSDPSYSENKTPDGRPVSSCGSPDMVPGCMCPTCALVRAVRQPSGVHMLALLPLPGIPSGIHDTGGVHGRLPGGEQP